MFWIGYKWTNTLGIFSVLLLFLNCMSMRCICVVACSCNISPHHTLAFHWVHTPLSMQQRVSSLGHRGCIPLIFPKEFQMASKVIASFGPPTNSVERITLNYFFFFARPCKSQASPSPSWLLSLHTWNPLVQTSLLTPSVAHYSLSIKTM